MKQSKETRLSSSCTECHRRKQKCSKEWPCNHCQARKVPHLCHFGPKKAAGLSPHEGNSTAGNSPVETLVSRRKRRRSTDDSEETSQVLEAGGNDGLKAWGYMPSHVNYKMGYLESEESNRSTDSGKSLSDEVKAVLHHMPSRSLTDSLVNHFLYDVNYRYNAIYPPTFTDQYVKWWANRLAGRPLSPEFTCLLFRVCAYSAQYLTPELRNHIEFEMATSVQALAERFHGAAEELSKGFSPDDGASLTRVQALFLKGVWEKSESMFVQSWHTLGAAVREAQELGFHEDKAAEDETEFDREIRRRLWCLLYVWDWQMSAWLSRPHLIAESGSSFRFPSLRLEESKDKPNLLSPFAHILLQAELGRLIFKISKEEKDESLVKRIEAIEDGIDGWINNLPAIFRLEDPDTSHDEEYPHIVFQRRQVHLTIHMTKLDPFRPYLATSAHSSLEGFNHFRELGVVCSLKVLQAAQRLYEIENPISPKFHLVIFCIFDTATLLCSALVHDTDESLPRRDDIQEALDSALDILHQFSLKTKIGVVSFKFLDKLVRAVPFLVQRNAALRPVKKRKKTGAGSTSGSIVSSSAGSLKVTSEKAVHEEKHVEQTKVVEDLPSGEVEDDSWFSLDPFLLQPGVEDSGLDMAGLEQIWDWDDLNIETGSN